MIMIVDYGIGNINSIKNMLDRVGAECLVSSKIEDMLAANKIILPGNGSFDACMVALKNTGLIPVIKRRVKLEGVDLLGICVGAQMLGNGSQEGSEPGLGLIDMHVRRFPALPGLVIPHMGWCQVQRTNNTAPMLKSLDDDARFYFVHSYFMQVARSQDILLTAHYGLDFAAAVQVDNITGVQFHPEKSHRYGKQLLKQFAGVVV